MKSLYRPPSAAKVNREMRRNSGLSRKEAQERAVQRVKDRLRRFADKKIRERTAAIEKATRTSLPTGREAILLSAPPARTMEELHAKYPRIRQSMDRINKHVAEKKAASGQPVNESIGKIAESATPTVKTNPKKEPTTRPSTAKPRTQPMSAERRRELNRELKALETEIEDYWKEIRTQRYKKKSGKGFFASAGQLLKNIWKGGPLFERVRPFRLMLTQGDITDREIRLQNAINRRDRVRTELAGAQAEPEARTAQAVQRAARQASEQAAARVPQQPTSQQAAARAPPQAASEQTAARAPPQPAAQVERRGIEIRKRLTPEELAEYYRNRMPAQSGGLRTEIRPKLTGKALDEAYRKLGLEGEHGTTIRPKIEPGKKAQPKGKEEKVA